MLKKEEKDRFSSDDILCVLKVISALINASIFKKEKFFKVVIIILLTILNRLNNTIKLLTNNSKGHSNRLLHLQLSRR